MNPAKNSYHKHPYEPQTISKWCCISHCSLFMTFIHCRHNSIVYTVSKQHKHHSTYPSICQCYEPGHFATFSPRSHFNNSFTHKTGVLQTGWWDLNIAPLLKNCDICMYIPYHEMAFRILLLDIVGYMIIFIIM